MSVQIKKDERLKEGRGFGVGQGENAQIKQMLLGDKKNCWLVSEKQKIKMLKIG